jgi:hypothetical protein
MWRQLGTAGAIAAVLVGCAVTDQPAPTALDITVPLYAAGGNTDYNRGTHLSGDEEVFTPTNPGDPTPADSRAQGQAILRVSDDGASVAFRLIASNIVNIVQSHIHCGRAGANGPIAMWLYPVIGPTGTALTGPTGRHDGVLASGVFSPGGVMCPASAVGVDMPLLDAIRAGLAYVNVHTNDGVAPNNTGPGDFPGGEIRGQLDHASTHGTH